MHNISFKHRLFLILHPFYDDMSKVSLLNIILFVSALACFGGSFISGFGSLTIIGWGFLILGWSSFFYKRFHDSEKVIIKSFAEYSSHYKTLKKLMEDMESEETESRHTKPKKIKNKRAPLKSKLKLNPTLPKIKIPIKLVWK